MKFRCLGLVCPLAVFAASPRQIADTMMSASPIRFEANDGQFPAQVRFGARFGAGPVSFTDSGALVVVGERAVRLRPVGGASVSPVGAEPLKSKASFFLGRRSASARQFGAVKYPGVYPGIDLVYHGDGKRLEYDFVLGPGADPARVEMEFDGADSLRLDGDTLVASVAGVEMRQPRPRVYQDSGDVAGGFELRGGNRVGFRVARYDRSRPLTIDPVIVTGTYLGGDSIDVATAIAFDRFGRLWVAGHTTSNTLPVTGGPFRDARAGNKDAFVAVFIPSLAGPDSHIYTTYVGGSEEDEARALAIDTAGTAHVAGFTASTDYPTRNGYQDANAGGRDAFMTQININERGDASLWYSTLIGGPQADVANAVAVDTNGQVYVAGYTASVEFPKIGAQIQPSLRGGWDAFFAQFAPALLRQASGVYTTFLGGGSTDVATGVAATTQGLFVTGYTMSEDFPVNDTPLQATYRGQGDMFITRIDRSKSGLDALSYSTYLGGTDLDQAWALASDAAGRLYLAGTTFSRDFPLSQNAFQTQHGGAADAVVLRFDLSRPRGQELSYSTFLGGTDTDGGFAVSADAQGRIKLVGYTFSENFPVRNTQPADLQDRLRGGFDAFAATLDPNNALGSASLVCATYVGGNGNETGYGVASDAIGNTYVVGSTTSRDLGIPDTAPQGTLSAYQEGFVARLNACRP
jgi:hypothetical protein